MTNDLVKVCDSKSSKKIFLTLKERHGEFIWNDIKEVELTPELEEKVINNAFRYWEKTEYEDFDDAIDEFGKLLFKAMKDKLL